MINHQLAVNLAGVFVQISWIIQARTGAELNPLQLPELSINGATHATMPKHGEHVVSLANVETIKVHKKKPGN